MYSKPRMDVDREQAPSGLRLFRSKICKEETEGLRRRCYVYMWGSKYASNVAVEIRQRLGISRELNLEAKNDVYQRSERI